MLKNKLKKSLIVAFISPVIAIGCSSTDKSHQYDEIQSNLTPINQFFKSFAFDKCDQEITFDNFDEVLKKRKSGVYGNPLNSDCVPISFNSPEKSEFYDEIVGAAKDKETARAIVDHVLGQGFDTKDDMAVTKIPLSDGRLAQIVKYTGEGIKTKTKQMLRRGGDLSLILDEFLFLHELFHLSDMNYDQSINQNIRETNSDIPAIIVLSTKYNMSLNQTIDMANDIRKFRRQEAINEKGKHDTNHFDKDMMDKFLNYLHELSVTGVGLERVASFKDAERLSNDIALDIKAEDRTGKYTFNYYWEKGMGIAENDRSLTASRMPFEQVIGMVEGNAKKAIKENSQTIERRGSEDDYSMNF